ncbi:hypothetical protein A3715_07570 [Oleiphilus sp. HI0009]|uniref:hypothetical protein n=1 Tax=unclassified Oleiphilus TaxID=2631174 RepID=UPI0007C28EFB|nr:MULTISPECIES: hypothetical protein [unclassified Oleiphilus]KZX72257.1 hypothetical protein A3715_26065 [Oleiphilus sp. HI0009]MCH2159641.1 hypothetical protein [Oleiphilaceae bacterium]KZX81380.1 hypothetical protein A3715_07570 [Oleiphilus sp. HI0009]KZY61910.1 hypothetical protein A3738_13295 [Oleiphilus sp. HI0066]KZY66311.1 hypothetical protein A3738_17060 [Oleiphilus sp. HI0066]
MVLFWPIQQQLDCISSSGRILGKIGFDIQKDDYIFVPEDVSLSLTGEEQAKIDERLAGLRSGLYLIPMQDDD